MRLTLQEWYAKRISERHGWQPGLAQYVRWEALDAFARGMDPHPDAGVRAVSWHRSKGLMLPVVGIFSPTLGLKIYGRDDFHDCAMTVESERPLAGIDPASFYDGGLSNAYFEGFERAGLPIHGPYADRARSGWRNFSFHAAVDHVESLVIRFFSAAQIAATP